MDEARFTECDLREAFKAGWKTRNLNPGLKRAQRRSLDNFIRGAIGGGRYNDYDLVPDFKNYSHSIWLRSDFRKKLIANAALAKARGEAA